MLFVIQSINDLEYHNHFNKLLATCGDVINNPITAHTGHHIKAPAPAVPAHLKYVPTFCHQANVTSSNALIALILSSTQGSNSFTLSNLASFHFLVRLDSLLIALSLNVQSGFKKSFLILLNSLVCSQ
jgi:hypothetical protein